MYERKILHHFAKELSALKSVGEGARSYRARQRFGHGFPYDGPAWLGAQKLTAAGRKQVSRDVERLEQTGLVRRATFCGDRRDRTTRVLLTASGVVVCCQLLPHETEAVRDVAERLGWI